MRRKSCFMFNPSQDKAHAYFTKTYVALRSGFCKASKQYELGGEEEGGKGQDEDVF